MKPATGTLEAELAASASNCHTAIPIFCQVLKLPSSSVAQPLAISMLGRWDRTFPRNNMGPTRSTRASQNDRKCHGVPIIVISLKQVLSHNAGLTPTHLEIYSILKSSLRTGRTFCQSPNRLELYWPLGLCGAVCTKGHSGRLLTHSNRFQ